MPRTDKRSRGYERNFEAITALETIHIIWLFYLMLLFLYDESILDGPRRKLNVGIITAFLALQTPAHKKAGLACTKLAPESN